MWLEFELFPTSTLPYITIIFIVIMSLISGYNRVAVKQYEYAFTMVGITMLIVTMSAYEARPVFHWSVAMLRILCILLGERGERER